MCAVRYNCLSRVAGCAHSTVYLPLKCLNKQNNAIEGWLLCFITIKLFLRNKEKCEKTAFPLTPFFLLVKVFNCFPGGIFCTADLTNLGNYGCDVCYAWVHISKLLSYHRYKLQVVHWSLWPPEPRILYLSCTKKLPCRQSTNDSQFNLKLSDIASELSAVAIHRQVWQFVVASNGVSGLGLGLETLETQFCMSPSPRFQVSSLSRRLQVLVTAYCYCLETLNITKKWLSKTSTT